MKTASILNNLKDYIEGYNKGMNDATKGIYHNIYDLSCRQGFKHEEKKIGYIDGWEEFGKPINSIVKELINNPPKSDYNTVNLQICFDNISNGGKGNEEIIRATIYYHNFPFFNCWKNDETSCWDANGKNKWQLNRSSIAILNNYTPEQYYFNTIKEMLEYLEKDFCTKYKLELPIIE